MQPITLSEAIESELKMIAAREAERQQKEQLLREEENRKNEVVALFREWAKSHLGLNLDGERMYAQESVFSKWRVVTIVNYNSTLIQVGNFTLFHVEDGRIIFDGDGNIQWRCFPVQTGIYASFIDAVMAAIGVK